MKRPRLFEFEDLPWFPKSIRDSGTDFLRHIWDSGNTYGPVVPKLKDALERTGSSDVIDLASGGGGPILSIHKELTSLGSAAKIILSDKYPNVSAYRYIQKQTKGGVGYLEEPVSATNVPEGFMGFRTMFTALHHFPPETVKAILEDAVNKGRPIGLFDLTAKSLPPLSIMTFGNPVGLLTAAPFIKPFRWRRLFWCYLVPIAPLYLMWDAFVSGLRLYSVKELKEIIASLPANEYIWDIGTVPFPHSVTYVIGYSQAGTDTERK